MKKPGDRVLAIYGTEDDGVRIFGAGVYVGDKVPGEDPAIPTPVGFIAELRPAGVPNPLIKFDSGKYVWGCECWWGPEEQALKQLEGKKVIVDDIDAVRAEVRANAANNTSDALDALPSNEEFQAAMTEYMKEHTKLFVKFYNRLYPDDGVNTIVPEHFMNTLAMTTVNMLQHIAHTHNMVTEEMERQKKEETQH